ncbi:MAG: hypothetical protein SGI71_00505 [Verrucomicrobiota bacterium]|nr:hypothetical protein [Verrucomicrobiota bacterium]
MKSGPLRHQAPSAGGYENERASWMAEFIRRVVLFGVISFATSVASALPGANPPQAPAFREWKYVSSFELTQKGPVVVVVPPEVVGVSLPDLSDLRVVAPDGIPVPLRLIVQGKDARFFAVSNLKWASDGRSCTFSAPSRSIRPDLLIFVPVHPNLKVEVRIQGSSNNKSWTELSRSEIDFTGAGGNSVVLAGEQIRNFRAIFNVPFREAIKSILIRASPHISELPSKKTPVNLNRTFMSGPDTVAEISWNAKNQYVKAVHIGVPENELVDVVSFLVPTLIRSRARPSIIATGSGTRNGQGLVELPVESRISAKRAYLKFTSRTQNLVLPENIFIETVDGGFSFLAQHTGVYRVFAGNTAVIDDPQEVAKVPRIEEENRVRPLTLDWANLDDNPDYVLQDLTVADKKTPPTDMDEYRWRFRQKLTVKERGVQELRIIQEVAQKAQRTLQDIRIVVMDDFSLIPQPCIIEKTLELSSWPLTATSTHTTQEETILQLVGSPQTNARISDGRNTYLSFTASTTGLYTAGIRETLKDGTIAEKGSTRVSVAKEGARVYVPVHTDIKDLSRTTLVVSHPTGASPSFESVQMDEPLVRILFPYHAGKMYMLIGNDIASPGPTVDTETAELWLQSQVTAVDASPLETNYVSWGREIRKAFYSWFWGVLLGILIAAVLYVFFKRRAISQNRAKTRRETIKRRWRR